MKRELWEDPVEAETTYLAARRRVFEVSAARQYELALGSPVGRGTALRALRDAPQELVMALISPLFDSATATRPDVGVARAVIARLDSGWLFLALESWLHNCWSVRRSSGRIFVGWSNCCPSWVRQIY